MCANHSIKLACLDNQAVVCCRHSRYTPRAGWNPLAGYPGLEGFPVELPRQEFWQDVDNILRTTSRPYCYGYGPDGVYRTMTQENVVSFARFDKIRREGVLGPATEKAEVSMKKERMLKERADFHQQVNLWDIRHLAEYVRPYDIGTPESERLIRLYPAAMPRRPVDENKRPYPFVKELGKANREETIHGRIYAKEKGRYPFSKVQRLPDVIPGDGRSNKERDRMERR
eukprot:2126090-Amphidinium_carterae.1